MDKTCFGVAVLFRRTRRSSCAAAAMCGEKDTPALPSAETAGPLEFRNIRS